MKTHNIIIALGLATTVAFVAGCSKQDESTPAEAGSAVPATVESVGAELNKAVEAAKPAVEQAVAEAKSTAGAAASEVTAKVNSLIEQAKTLMGETKYTEALNTLQQLANFKLTPEQAQVVTNLKEQIQKALAAKGAANPAEAAAGALTK